MYDSYPASRCDWDAPLSLGSAINREPNQRSTKLKVKVYAAELEEWFWRFGNCRRAWLNPYLPKRAVWKPWSDLSCHESVCKRKHLAPRQEALSGCRLEVAVAPAVAVPTSSPIRVAGLSRRLADIGVMSFTQFFVTVRAGVTWKLLSDFEGRQAARGTCRLWPSLPIHGRDWASFLASHTIFVPCPLQLGVPATQAAVSGFDPRRHGIPNLNACNMRHGFCGFVMPCAYDPQPCSLSCVRWCVISFRWGSRSRVEGCAGVCPLV